MSPVERLLRSGGRERRSGERNCLKRSVTDRANDLLAENGYRHGSLSRAVGACDLHEGSSYFDRPCAWLGLYRQAVLEAALKALRTYQERHPGNVLHTLVGMLTGGLAGEAGAAGDEPSDADLAERLGRGAVCPGDPGAGPGGAPAVGEDLHVGQ
jgi:hypothetical protein